MLRVQRENGRAAVPANLELADVSENVQLVFGFFFLFLFFPVGRQWLCHRREETMLSKEGHMWLCGAGRGERAGLCKVTHRVPVTVK